MKVSVKNYAKKKGVTRSHIYQLLNDGIIPADAVQKKGRGIQIDEEKADAHVLPKASAQTSTGLSYTDAKTLSEKYKAALLKIELDTQTGKLVSAEEVKRTAFTTGRQLRDALLAIPDRVAPMITADPEKAADILTKEISQALEVLSV